MESLHYYSLRKAAEILQEPEEKVLDWIRAGRLKAQFLTNIMDYIITHEDLMKFLKEKKDFGTMKKVLQHRVILVDRDLKVQDVVKLELGRKNVQVRVATTDREVQILIDDFLPDVVAVSLGATTRAIDPVKGALDKAKAAKRYVVLYHTMLEDTYREKTDIQAHVQRLAPNAVVNISRGMSPLVEVIKKAVGVK
jgi:hypothetical protein